MNLTVTAAGPLQGSIRLPGDKSLSHRAALFAALARGESRIENFLVSGVTRAMLDALTALGVPYALQGTTLSVQGRGPDGLNPPAAPLNCGNSATTLRLLAGALAMAGVPAVLDGSVGRRKRPMERIVDPLRQMGVDIITSSGCAPLTLGRSTFPLRPLDYRLPVASAQVKTCLLLAALAAGGPSTLREPGPSRDHTERLLRSLGVSLTAEKGLENGAPVYITRLVPPYSLQLPPLRFVLPGDFSAAAFLIVAGLIVPGSRLTLHDVGLNPGRTGLLDALLSMGADICIDRPSTRGGEPVGDLIVTHSRLHGTDISGEQVVRMIDEFPIFAVAAACAEGVSRVSDAAELRLKESDRISGL
ncbi:MAG TPA: 3-phosphoshikimate 1-carboxyvinyltransferase, partial [Polyangia bacterium]